MAERLKGGAVDAHRIFQIAGFDLIGEPEPGIVLQQLARFQIENPIFQVHQFFAPVELVAAAPKVFPPSQSLGDLPDVICQQAPGGNLGEGVRQPGCQLRNGPIAPQLFIVGERLPILGEQKLMELHDLVHQIGEEVRALARAFGSGRRRFRLLFLRKPLALPPLAFSLHLTHTSTEILRIVILVLVITVVPVKGTCINFLAHFRNLHLNSTGLEWIIQQ